MSAFEIIALLGIASVIVLEVWRSRQPAAGNTTDAIREKIGDLQTQLEMEKTEKNKLAGQNKQMYAEHVSLKEEAKSLTKERDAMAKRIAQYESKEDQYEKDAQRKLQELTNAKEKFEQEQRRVIHEDEEERAQAAAERDRLWAEHEKNVIAQLMSLCKLPQLGFAHFTNTNLPEEFDGSLKPDFMIEFLDQYVIFDAKVSKAESLQTYINNAVKTTTQKVKKNAKIASMIYLVVPTEAISELKTFVYPVDGYTIYVVSPEALPSILASMKKITTYEFADQMDPQQRENIVQLIAELDFHINLQNAANIIMTKRGTEILERAQHVDPELAADVALKKQPMNAKATLAAAELKKIVSSLMEQNMEIDKLIAPKASVKKKDLKSAETVIMESLL